MKKFTLLSVMLLAGILLASMANAQLTLEAASLGSSSAERGDNVTDTMVLTNTGATTVTGITLTSSVDAAAYKLGFSGVPTSLIAGATATITVNAVIPLDADAVNSNLDDGSLKVGSIIASGNNGSAISVTSDLTVQIQNHLEIKKIIVTINGDEQKSLDDGDEIDDLKPGDKLSFEVQLENTFDSDDDEKFDVDFEDGDIELDVDGDIDLSDDSVDSVDISADDVQSEDFTADVELEASGSYTLTIRAKATTDDGSLHGQEIKIDLKVKRESHELQIDTATVSSLICGKETFDVKVNILNSGKSNEDEAAIEVSIPGLNLLERRDALELDKDDELSRTFAMSLPANTKSGSYSVEVKSYWNDDIQSDERILTLIVPGCDAKPTTPVVTPSTPVTSTPTTPIVMSKTNSKSFWDSGAGIASMIIGIAAVLAIIVALIWVLVRKPVE